MDIIRANEPVAQITSHISKKPISFFNLVACSLLCVSILSVLVSNYLTQLHCICVLWTHIDIDQIQNIKIISNNENGSDNNVPQALVWLKYENESNVDDFVCMGIDSGCQAFIGTPDSILRFFDAYDNVRFTAQNRYHLMHVVVLSTPKERVQIILNHPVVQGEAILCRRS